MESKSTGNYAQIRISEKFCKFTKPYKYNMVFSDRQPEHFLKPGKSHVNSLSTVLCFLHTSCQWRCQQPSPQRSYLYKPPSAQLVSLLDFLTCFWRAAWLLFHTQFCSSLSVKSGMGFPLSTHTFTASLPTPHGFWCPSKPTFPLAVWAMFPVQPQSVIS